MWDVSDVGDYLKVSTTWVYRRFGNGTLPGLRLPGSGTLRFDPEQIKAYAKGQWPPKKGA